MTSRLHKGKSMIAFPDDYTVVDIETNGFNADNCEIIEISAIRIRNNIRVDSFSSLIKPKRRIDRFITNLTGISDKTVENAPDIVEVLNQFKKFLGDDIVLGYNVNFDINFLYDNFMQHYGIPLTNSYVDVLRLARRAIKDIPNHKQTTVAEYFGIKTDGAHRALRDCEICDECYRRLRYLLSR